MAIKSESRLSVGHNARPFNEQTREAAGSCSSSSILDIIPVPLAHEAIKTNEIKQAQTNIKKLTWKKPIACDCFGLGGRWRQEEQYLEKNVEFVEFSRPTVEL